MEEIEEIIISSVGLHNIIPLTSRCNLSCIYCSHRGNPPGLKVYRIPDLTAEDVFFLLDFVDPKRKIIIGESATRIIEGEPLLNPQFRDILKIIRRRMPETEIQITTNGTLIDRDTASFLKTIEPVELIVSVNSRGAFELHKQKMCCKTIRALEHLSTAEIPFGCSLVPLPFITGWEELDSTLKLISETNALYIRVILPGITKYSLPEMQYDFDELTEKFKSLIKEKYSSLRVPIVLEPGEVDDLRAVAEGIILRSPAFEAGLKAGDEICRINGFKPWSRVDAFQKLYAWENPELEYKRGSSLLKCVLHKGKNSPPGVIMYYDFDPQRAFRMKEQLLVCGGTALVLTSQAGFQRVKLALHKLGLLGPVEVRAVKSRFFGGNISCSGLLTVRDIISELRNLKEPLNYKLIMLPDEIFDARGRDLGGRHFSEIRNSIDIPVMLM